MPTVVKLGDRSRVAVVTWLELHTYIKQTEPSKWPNSARQSAINIWRALVKTKGVTAFCLRCKKVYGECRCKAYGAPVSQSQWTYTIDPPKTYTAKYVEALGKWVIPLEQLTCVQPIDVPSHKVEFQRRVSDVAAAFAKAVNTRNSR